MPLTHVRAPDGEYLAKKDASVLDGVKLYGAPIGLKLTIELKSPDMMILSWLSTLQPVISLLFSLVARPIFHSTLPAGPYFTIKPSKPAGGGVNVVWPIVIGISKKDAAITLPWLSEAAFENNSTPDCAHKKLPLVSR